jgi:thiosulfate dehydrogenase
MKRALVLFLLGCSNEPRVEEVVRHATAAEHGRALFDEETNGHACATCHPLDAGDTSRIWPGAPLAGATERPTFWGGQENDLLRSINHCRFYLQGIAEAWTPEDEEAKAMYALLTSLPAAATEAQPFTIPRSAADLPVGDPVLGEELYARSCRTCHGAAHTGEGRLREGALLLPEEAVALFVGYGFDATLTRISFIEKVRHGGFLGLWGIMPPYSLEALSDEQLGAILGYLGL